MRKISYDSFVKDTSLQGSEIDAPDSTSYQFTRVLDDGSGPHTFIHTIPLIAVSDAMSNYGFTAEEAIEYHLLRNEAVLFPDESTTGFAASLGTILSDPDTEFLDLQAAAGQAVSDAINSSLASASLSRTSFTEEDIAELVFSTVNPGEGSSPVPQTADVSEYQQKRSTMKTNRMQQLQASYSINKDAPAWADVVNALNEDASTLASVRKVVSNYRFAPFIAEGSSRVIPPEPPKPTPSPDPVANPGQLDTTSESVGDSGPAPVEGDQGPDPVNPSESGGS